MKIIFETKRLFVRELVMSDLNGFHEMQGNPNVMKYVGANVLSFDENKKDLEKVIAAYTDGTQLFNVWAAVTRQQIFAGTVALIKNDKNEWEIGYRLIENAWGNGYGSELTEGLIAYAINVIGLKELVAYVDINNKASLKILEKYMTFKEEFWNGDEGCMERKYALTAKQN